MAKRKDSMLEAFQASAAEGAGPEPKAPSPLEVGGPFAPIGGKSAGTAGRRPGVLRPRTRRGEVEPELSAVGPPPLPFSNIAFLFVQILLLAGAFALGRLTGGVQASAGGEGGTEPGAQPLSASSSAPASDAGGDAQAQTRREDDSQEESEPAARLDFATDADRAFEDPANKYTIQTIQYTNAASELKRSFAYKTYDHLQERGLPVVRPWQRGNNIFIYVGAAPATKDLSDLLQRVRNTPGPHGSDAFASALLVPIPD